MLQSPILWTRLSAVVATAAFVLQSLQSLETDPSSSLNQSSQSRNKSIVVTTKIRCDGQQYGKDLNIEECKQAFHSITRTSKQVSFGERRSVETYEVIVPHRFISGRTSSHSYDKSLLKFYLTAYKQIMVAVLLMSTWYPVLSLIPPALCR